MWSLIVPETIYGGYQSIAPRIIQNCDNLYSYMNRSLLSWELVCLSNDLGNSRIIPFLFSIGIIPMTFLFVEKATKSTITGVLAAIGISINPVFLIFDDSAAFPQVSAFLIITSMYLAYRSLYLVSPVFLFAVMAKPVALFFVPALLIMLYPNKKPMILLFSVFLAIIGYTLLGGVELMQGSIKSFDLYGAIQEMFWVFTKHLSIWILPPLLLTCIFYKNRLSIALCLSITSYVLVSASTTAAIFPYHTIPIYVLMSAILAQLIVSKVPKKTQTISTNIIKT